MADEAGEKLRIVELTTDSDDIARRAVRARHGGGGRRVSARADDEPRAAAARLRAASATTSGCARVQAFIGVPVREGGAVRGVLCADRFDDRPFSAADEEVLSACDRAPAARDRERARVRAARAQQARARGAAPRLAGARGGPDRAGRARGRAVGGGARSRRTTSRPSRSTTPTTRVHCVRKAIGDGAELLANLSFRDNTSLTAMAVKNRHYLPYRGEFDPRQPGRVHAQGQPVGMQSLLILPLRRARQRDRHARARGAPARGVRRAGAADAGGTRQPARGGARRTPTRCAGSRSSPPPTA